MWINEGLNWIAHIAKVSSTLSKTVGVLFKIRNYVSMPCLKIFYYSFIQSKLIYGTLTWEGTTKEDLSHLSTTQHKTLRSITCSPRRLNLTKLYKKCEILQQDKLYKLEVAKFVFRIHNDAMPSQFASMYNNQRWSRGHKARGQGQGQGHKKNPRPRPRPRTAFPRTDTLEAKDRNARGQGQGPRTQSASALQKKKKRSSQKFFRRSPKKKKKKKKRSSQKFFRRSPLKNVFQKIFQAFHKILTL